MPAVVVPKNSQTHVLRAVLGAWLMLIVACSRAQDAYPPQAADENANSTVVTGISYSASGQQLDVFVPTKNVRRTALLFVHGGGFTSGSRKDMAGYARLYAQGGFVSATLDYRLAPRFPAPAAVDDVNAAVGWLKAGAGRQRLRIDQVVLVGYSAGGTLALMAALTRPGTIAAVVSAAAPTDLALLAATTPHGRLKSDIAGYLAGTPSQAASPIGQPLTGAPPMFLIHGDKDALVPIAQSVMLAERLRDAGVKVLLRTVPDVGHEVLLPHASLAEILREISRFVVTVDGSR